MSVNYVHVFGQHYTEKSVRSLEALQELVGGEKGGVVLGCSLVTVRLMYKCHTFCCCFFFTGKPRNYGMKQDFKLTEYLLENSN